MKYELSSPIKNGDATQPTLTGPTMAAEAYYSVTLFSIASGSTISGTVAIQISLDNVVQANQVVNWAPLTGATLAVSGAGNLATTPILMGTKWMRVVYTGSTSVAGALITVNLKANCA